jgi:hypothetical protein
VQKPDTQTAPPHWELLVQAFLQVPDVAPLHTWELPQSLLALHVDEVHPVARQSSLPQWLSFVQTHLLRTQLPFAQGLLPEQLSGTQLPTVAPVQDAPLSEQSLLVAQVCVEQVPTTGGMQVAPKPQSVSALQELVVETSASADTWKSLKTTRPHWLVGAAATGVLKVMLSSMSVLAEPLDLPYIQRWLGGLMADFASQRGSLIDIWPSVVDAPTLTSHCANATPLGKDWSTFPVIGSL